MDGTFCPNCGHRRLGNLRYCTSCKFDFQSGSLGPADAVAPAAQPPIAAPAPSGGSRTAERVVIVLIVATILGGLAYLLGKGQSGGADVAGAPSTSEPTARPASTRAATPGLTRPPKTGVSSACVVELGTLADALMELDSRLAIGMPFATYSDQVAGIRVAYDRIDVAALDSWCLTQVGVPAEAALTNYTYAYRIWNACMDKLSCTLDSIEAKLQEYWAKSTEQIDQFRFVMR